MSVISLTDADFESVVLNSDKPVLLDFWAPWCKPCVALAPTLNELADHFGDKAVIAKLNIDENQETPAQFAVRSIPTLMLFNNGKVEETIIGNQTSKNSFIELINNYI